MSVAADPRARAQFLLQEAIASSEAHSGAGLATEALAAAMDANEPLPVLVALAEDDACRACFAQTNTSPLHMAAVKGHADLARALLLVGGHDAGHRASPLVPWDVNARNDIGSTPLMLACSAGHAAVVDALLLAPNCDVNATDVLSQTALMMATDHDDMAIVAALLRAPNIDVHLVDHCGKSALDYRKRMDSWGL